MSIATEIARLQQAKADLKTSITAKGVPVGSEHIDEYAALVDAIPSGGGPSTEAQGIFTGATVPITYRNSSIDYEYIYHYKSNSHNITITGLDSVSTITNNGTKHVTVTFDRTSSSSSLTPFTITCFRDTETLTYNGLYGYYGTELTSGQVLAFACINVPRDGVPVLDTHYKFVVGTTLPYFSNYTTIWNTINSTMLLNILLGTTTVTSIGDYFMRDCYALNQPLTLPSSVTSIGNYFMRDCRAYNQPLTIPNSVTSIGTDFMSYCYALNQSLTIPNSVTSIGDYFMSNCYAYNQPLTIPNNITSIGTNFMYNCYAYNQPLTLPNSVTSIGDYFIYNCCSFNQPLTIPNSVTSIGSSFMYDCRAYNQPLTIPNSVTSIGMDFMRNCYALNQPLTLPNSVTSIETNFMYNCYAYNQPLTLPNSVTSIGNNFMRSCYALSTIIYNSSVYPTDTNSLGGTSTIKSSSTFGVKIYGTNRSGLLSALSNVSGRYLIDGGSI